MRPPHPCTANICFLAEDANELIRLIGDEVGEGEAELIHEYYKLGIPPVTSRDALSAMFGYNPGFVWSLLNRPRKHYRTFEIPKGQEVRTITAPKVALKIIQKWLSVHFASVWTARPEVCGFVPGRSHIQAASRHVGCHWVASVDIENFFPSVPHHRVVDALRLLGYRDPFSLEALTDLTCFMGGLAQGAPSSPVLSNIALSTLDEALAVYASDRGFVYSRYADDIVLSGKGDPPPDVHPDISQMVRDDGWNISERKSRVDKLPGRLKVHGLLVSGERVRLTKGYRNKIRAFRHLINNGGVKQKDLARIRGHLAYAEEVDRFAAGKI